MPESVNPKDYIITPASINPIIFMRLAVTLLILMIFTEASIVKWMEWTAPDWFIAQFKDSWMGNLPQTPMFLSIAFLETIVAIGAWVSLFTLEWLRPPARILRWVLVGVLFIFIMLCFGQRVSGDYSSAAFSFLYFAGTLLMFYVIDHDDRKQLIKS